MSQLQFRAVIHAQFLNSLLGPLLLVAFCGFLFFYHLGERDLWSAHEGRAAQNAQSILRENCWGLPRLFDGRCELQKPPLYYWLVALTARLHTGTVTAWDVRLPAALAALGTALVLFVFLHKLQRPRSALSAGLILASAVHFTWMARVGRVDMPLTLTTSVALVAFYLCSSLPPHPHPDPPPSRGREIRWLALLGYLAVAAGVMLKGPIAAVLPAVVMFAHAVVEGQARRWRRQPKLLLRSSLWWGIPLVLALTAPWFCWVNEQTNGDFFRVFFLHHNLERGLGGSDDLKVHPWWFYGPRLLIDFLPWSPLLLVAFWWLWRRGAWHADAEARFGFVWCAGMIALLSCSSFKRSDYLLPAYPGAALVLGCVMDRWLQAAAQPRRWKGAFAAVLLCCLAGWWLYLAQVLPHEEQRRDQRPFAAAIRRLVPQPQYVLFFRAECHELAFHLGYPLDTFLEWENLDVWAGRPGRHYIVMPPDCAAEWHRHVSSGRLVEVLRNTDLVPRLPRHQQFVLMCTTGDR